MSKYAICVENLSKQYHIGAQRKRHNRLGYQLADTLVAPFRRAGKMLRGRARSAAELDETIWALREISFEVKSGEVLGIIGRNGAGKSTLLRILSRITEPTEGRARVRGRVGSLLEVGTGFHPELTGRENIYLNGAILGMNRAEIDGKFDEIVAFSEVEKFIDTPVKHYSSGMYVRLAFSVAAHTEPEILLVDEVLAVGDAAFQKKCLGKMGDVSSEGRTVLFVSHNLIALRSLCSEAVWLDEGKLREEGPSSVVVTNYLKLQATKVYRQSWDDPATAPGNEIVRLHRVWAEPENGSSDAGIPREAPLNIGIEYWHLDPTAQLHVTLHIYVEQQVVAFATGSSHDPAWHKYAQQPGLKRSICRIPAYFLNTGQHRVKLLIIKDQSRAIYTLEDALSFEVSETAERTGSWYGKEPGVVRPRMKWTTSILMAHKRLIKQT